MNYDSKQKQTCALCGKEFPHNKNGNFTSHLKKEHGLTLNKYLIENHYSNEELQCKSCKEMVDLRRGIPNEYCSNCFRSANTKTGTKTCIVCGKEFKYNNSAQSKNQTCSKRCGYRIVSKKVKEFNKNLTKDEKKLIKSKMSKTKIRNNTTNNGRIPWNKGKTGIYSQETLDKIRASALCQFENQEFRKTNCELAMESILKELDIKYKYSHVVNDRQFDYLILDTNILIECDGDFWHTNLSTGKYKNLTYIQEQNQINDIYKTALAQEAGYYLFRFWEYEIINHRENVKQRILAIASILGDNQQPS